MNLAVGPVIDPSPAPAPAHVVIEGRHCRLRPLDLARDAGLFALSHGPEAESQWAYLAVGPFATRAAFDEYLGKIAAGTADPVFWAVADRDDRAIGWLSLMRIDRPNRVIEIGSILYTPALQHTTAGTEAQYLIARHVFETLGYRRYEWKCNDLNAPSRRAALRLGFTYEGRFRQHMIVKGRNRDTAWFSKLDREWPARKAAFEAWLAPGNFDEAGRQRTSLAALMAARA
jgi:RimJ/RimL family protein N-acetyltransferase